MPDSPEQLAAQIRFFLDELSSRNGHHEFEHLCRQFARLRITPTVMPATGPVSGGGDQGRDFETFRSYIGSEMTADGAFVGKEGEGILAFACSLQRDSIPSKIRSDIKTIMASGEKPSRIYFFSSHDVKVSDRHALANEVRESHGIGLDIIDGQALGEGLAAPDTFWIAERYLRLPASLSPAIHEESPLPDWYLESRNRWREREHPRHTLGDALDLKDGLRQATLYLDARSDLGFWLDLMYELVGDDSQYDVRQRARYEIVLAKGRVDRDLRPVDDLIRGFFSDSAEDNSPGRMEDGGVLLTMVGVACVLGQTGISSDEMLRLNSDLREKVRRLADSEDGPNRKARYLATLGTLALLVDPTKLEVEDSAPRESFDIAELVGPNGRLENESGGFFKQQDLIDIDQGMTAWSELAALLDLATLFPIDSFSRLLSLMAPTLVDHDSWRDIADSVDEASAKAQGAGAVGGSATSRAMTLRKAGRIREALHELHSAKANWWSGDNLRGALLAMLEVAQCYQTLNLPKAAKQYALAVSAAVDPENDDGLVDLLPVSVLMASELDYLAGDWSSALDLVEIGMLMQSFLVDPESNELVSGALSRAVHTLGMCLGAGRQLAPHMVSRVEEVAEKFGLLEEINSVLDDDSTSAEEWLARTDDQLLGRPFSDSIDTKFAKFAALGTRWMIFGQNDYLTSIAIERLAAAVQILLVELADDDLCLIETEIHVFVSLDEVEAGGQRVRASASNEERRWIVRLTPPVEEDSADGETQFAELLSVISTMLLEISLLPQPVYFSAITKAFENGLGHKLASGLPYDDLAQLVSRAQFEHSRPTEGPLPDPSAAPFHEHPALPWQDGPGPLYSPDKALELVSGRYSRMAELVPFSLAALSDYDPFQEVLLELRQRGWLDWHVLLAVVNISQNFRLRRDDLISDEMTNDPESVEAIRGLQATPELSRDDVPALDQFTTENMEFHRVNALPASIAHWDLELRQMTPDLQAVENLLAERFGYWTDDAAHPVLF